jgi:hypothetical protein
MAVDPLTVSLFWPAVPQVYSNVTSFIWTTRTIIASNHGLQSPGYLRLRASGASNSIREQLLAL